MLGHVESFPNIEAADIGVETPARRCATRSLCGPLVVE